MFFKNQQQGSMKGKGLPLTASLDGNKNAPRYSAGQLIIVRLEGANHQIIQQGGIPDDNTACQ